ncbi:MAG: hypothetical protein L6243_01670 [Candidatus Altiarchaeales archaeon]|nr:hypothetical protein [Candidatus Altiarchaeota archaeon]MBU4341621.1 hypothetical protein [Candidatus Altiarchaeota archaeon]MBU4406927.1 hypothetical protein [Candidatus Altiarchaeota archaeon]MBU4437173.1 hypothetical protein [Candidatus Altiarchaeota archaeon]MCG2782279.1 hypothetical protein [Candidatus Altiarchaeales archaeon]
METVVKVGGSLCRDQGVLERLCDELNEMGGILVVPGGGEFADTVRGIDREFRLDERIAHRLAILAMQQTGVLIGEFFKGEIFDCAALLDDENLKASWDVTSDSIAAYIAKERGAKRLIILKDVDGVFTADPKKGDATADPNKGEAKLIPEVTTEELSAMESSCLDREFPGFVKDSGLEVWIINGKHPERIKEILNNKKTKGTRIL